MKNVASKRRLTREWEGVRRYRSWITANSVGSSGFVSSQFLDFCHSLVLVHAYLVLQAALQQYKREGAFAAKGGELAVLMKASRSGLTWVDYGTIRTGRTRRNAVAHGGEILPRVESWKYAMAIERELVRWSVIPEQPPW